MPDGPGMGSSALLPVAARPPVVDGEPELEWCVVRCTLTAATSVAYAVYAVPAWPVGWSSVKAMGSGPGVGLIAGRKSSSRLRDPSRAQPLPPVHRTPLWIVALTV